MLLLRHQRHPARSAISVMCRAIVRGFADYARRPISGDTQNDQFRVATPRSSSVYIFCISDFRANTWGVHLQKRHFYGTGRRLFATPVLRSSLSYRSAEWRSERLRFRFRYVQRARIDQSAV
jgi:hypothetical protein